MIAAWLPVLMLRLLPVADLRPLLNLLNTAPLSSSSNLHVLLVVQFHIRQCCIVNYTGVSINSVLSTDAVSHLVTGSLVETCADFYG